MTQLLALPKSSRLLLLFLSFVLIVPACSDDDSTTAPTTSPPGVQPGDCLSSDEHELATLINAYRANNGLAAIPVTVSLTAVAQWHVWDLDVNTPTGGTCNLHSWSDSGSWSAVCYTSDHAQAQGMWDKPREITEDAYSGNGYEIAYWSSGTATASGALAGWQSSSGHNDVILNQGIWTGRNPWPAMGVGMLNGYAVVWFGDIADPQGNAVDCP